MNANKIRFKWGAATHKTYRNCFLIVEQKTWIEYLKKQSYALISSVLSGASVPVGSEVGRLSDYHG